MGQEDDGSLLLAFRGRHDEVLPIATAPHWSGPYTRLLPAGVSIFPSGCAPQFCNGSICHDDRSLLTGIDVRDISRPQVGASCTRGFCGSNWLFTCKVERSCLSKSMAHAGTFKCLEDPFLFRHKSGSFHMILHNQVGEFAGAHGEDCQSTTLNCQSSLQPHPPIERPSLQGFRETARTGRSRRHLRTRRPSNSRTGRRGDSTAGRSRSCCFRVGGGRGNRGGPHTSSMRRVRAWSLMCAGRCWQCLLCQRLSFGNGSYARRPPTVGLASYEA